MVGLQSFKFYFFNASKNVFLFLKVSKSRKQFLVFSILPKNEQKTKKYYPESSQDIVFLEELRIPKISFEIF